jgi:N-acetyl-gamma-glutamyl-phosphate reductase
MNIKSCILGASGYTGAELVRLLEQHAHFDLQACFVSPNSQDANKAISDVHKQLLGVSKIVTQAINEDLISELADEYDAIFLATPHEASHDWANKLAFKKAKIFDLSGAFRLSNPSTFEHYYGFEHTQTNVLEHAVYGLAEWHQDEISHASFVAVPGCYPTASLMAIKPIVANGLLDTAHRPIINATSGVTGAGKKLSQTTHFSEVSLQAYGVLGHRHTPEIAEYAQTPVIFTPHLGQFKRGILSTITMKLNEKASEQTISQAFEGAYADKPLIRLRNTMPKVDDVAHSPFCDIAYKFDADSGYLVVSSAIDNLLKGAASQALQCANLAFGMKSTQGLL